MIVFILTVFVGNAVQSLPIRRGFSYGKRNEVTSSLVEKVIDLETPQSIDDCYVSPRGKKPWARFDIPWSLITHVDILNVPAGNGWFEFLIQSELKRSQNLYFDIQLKQQASSIRL